MTFIEMLAARRSHRTFQPRPVEREKIDALLRATLTAPSSKNCRSTRLAVIEDKEKLAKIALMRNSGSGFVKDAPAAILVMGDAADTDLWVDNCAISATTLQYAAESLGLGTCWVHVNGRPHDTHDPAAGTAEEWLRTFLPIPAGWHVLCAVVVGYPANELKPHTPKDDADKVFCW
ncbi:MAG: nitroreductase family protein [Rikenellaceae bacterium]|jgi:nitroreductase|nr:nitroreductase family protein [Rikenellaceae bacterium]